MNIHNYLPCILLLAPVFIWNALLYSKLPAPYQKAIWDKVPKSLDILENVFRIIVFFIPIFMKLQIDTPAQKAGLILYCIGIVIYFLSWYMQIKYPASAWSASMWGFIAPAYTTIIWFTGIALIGQELLIKKTWWYGSYFLFILFFVIIHTCHAVYVYRHSLNK
ncbi:MAG TPA: hypothetical protein PLP19_17080 [bacterium]|nr:hypothetical protein [bacterium]HPN45209.1 hypothetical protein [bacterium]